MFDSILDSVKGEIADSLTSKLGLSGSEVDTTISSTKDALSKTMSGEAESNGLSTITNLFSGDENSSSSNDLLSSLGGNLMSSLSSNGFSSDKAGSIKDLVLPLVMKLVADKIGGNSDMLSGLLGKGDLASKASGLLKGFMS